MEEYEMTTRRRFTGEFKAKVALEALRGDRTIQGPCQRKIACPAGVLILASLDEKPLPLFQDIARDHPPGGHDVHPVPFVITAG